MAVKIRCTECRQTVPAAATAKGAQRVCCKKCSNKRHQKLARRRRRARVQEYRADEVRRKRAQRERARERWRGLTCESESASCPKPVKCHAPGSADNQPKILIKIAKIVDEDLKMSRTRLRKEIAQVILKTAAQRSRAGP